MDAAEAGRIIVEEARALGFARVGLAPVEPAARHGLYEEWLARGYAGEMTYLQRDGAARKDPRAVFESARTVVVVALAYGDPAVVPIRTGPTGLVARYARGTDYHMVLKVKLGKLAARVETALGQPVAARACVDTAPLLERDLAERAGLGFVAKNTLLIAPGLGSYVVLGELLVDVDATAAADPESARKRCGTCRACLDMCPTQAFVDAYVLDARRCISYLTIEHAGPIPRELREAVGTRIFGCDVCQEVCPFNAAAATNAPPAPELAPRGEKLAPELLRLLGLGAAQFRQFVKRSALRRVHRAQLLRNVCVALGNAGDDAAVPALRRTLASATSPLVREHAVWALGKLGDVEYLRGVTDADSTVNQELAAWR